jgi:hypothetical protein
MDMDRFPFIEDKSKGQVSGTLMGLNLLMKTRMKLPFHFRVRVLLITYADHSYSTTAVAAEDFVQRYKVGEKCRCLFELDVRNK